MAFLLERDMLPEGMTRDRLELLAKGDSWVCIQDDEGKSLAQFILILLQERETQNFVTATLEQWSWDKSRVFVRDNEISFPVEAAHRAVEAFCRRGGK